MTVVGIVMLLKSSVPSTPPIAPSPVFTSLSIKDSLSSQREHAREIYFRSCQIADHYAQYFSHPEITAERMEWVLARTDHTTLRNTRNEPKEWMTRMAREATYPFPMRAVCTWGDFGDNGYTDKITPLIEFLKDYPNVGIAVVLGYPHGFLNPDDAKRQIAHAWEKLKDVSNPVDFDSVINYEAWMDGDHEKVRRILMAEQEARLQTKFTWKSIQKVSVHAYASRNVVYGADYFRSVYDSTIMSLECGTDMPKTSTGAAAKPPYHDFVPKDTGFLPRALPMLFAIRDFNLANNTQRAPKFSGGNDNEADAALLYNAAREILGEEVCEKIAYGTSYRFRRQLLQFIADQQGHACEFDRSILTTQDTNPFFATPREMVDHNMPRAGASYSPAP